ncbi:MAG: ribonuclease HII [Dehalococcoidia bacterium]
MFAPKGNDRPRRTTAAGCDTERALWRAGYSRIAGVDEVGRGPLAGPVVAAAVVLPPFFDGEWLPFVRDSKALTARQRERLARFIHRDALAYGVGIQPADCIDRAGLACATRLAVSDALDRLAIHPDFLLLDAFIHRPAELDQIALIKGDVSCASIACASIIAKVARDEILCGLDQSYPGYGFAVHKGYGTPAHLAALAALGPSPIHRRSFAPVRNICS